MKKLLNIFLVIVMMLSIAVPTTTVSAATKPTMVKLSSVTASSSTSIKIKWKKVSGADGYVIYQKAGSGSYKKIKTITSGKTTSYTKKNLTSAKKYTYKIKAYDKSGSKKIYGAYSNTKSTYTKPAKVKLSSVTASSSTSIKIKWKKVSGADGYVIYQKASSGSYKKIKTITSGKTTSYTNKKLSANKKYTYKIKAYKIVGSKKIYGSYSSTKSVKTKSSQTTPSQTTPSNIDRVGLDNITVLPKEISRVTDRGYVYYKFMVNGVSIKKEDTNDGRVLAKITYDCVKTYDEDGPFSATSCLTRMIIRKNGDIVDTVLLYPEANGIIVSQKFKLSYEATYTPDNDYTFELIDYVI